MPPEREDGDANFENWLQILLLVVVAVVGFKVISRYGEPRFGDPAVCDGIGFGCSPSQFADTVSVWFILFAGLVGTAIIRHFVSKTMRWLMTAAGVAFACGLAGVVWNGNIVRYGVPDVSVAEGRAEASRLLAVMVGAVGTAVPLAVPEESVVPQAPSPAEVVAAIPQRGPVACVDVNDRDTGTSRFVWQFRREVFVPRTALPGSGDADVRLPASFLDQLNALDRALNPSSDGAFEGRDGPTFWEVGVSKAGPPPRSSGYLPTYEYAARVSMGFIADRGQPNYRVIVEAGVSTPCLREVG